MSFDLPNIAANVDFINLMSYDLHGSWETITGINAPLFGTDLNVDAAVKILLNAGVARDKIIMGIPTYGNSWTLSSSSNNGVGAPATYVGPIRYYEICPRVNSGSLTYHWVNDEQVPYAVSGAQWVGYNDVRSVTLKANYAMSQNLGGAMIWDLDNDDFSGSCGQGRFPLISAIFNVVVGGTVAVSLNGFK